MHCACHMGYNLPTLSPGPSPRSKWRIGETPGQGFQSGPKNSLKFRHVNTMKRLRFVSTMVSDCRTQTGLPDAGNNLRKRHFTMCHVTKYPMILKVFQQPRPGVSPIHHFERGEGPGDEVEKIASSFRCKISVFLFLHGFRRAPFYQLQFLMRR